MSKKLDPIVKLVNLLKSQTGETIKRKDLVAAAVGLNEDETFTYPALRVPGASVSRGTYSLAKMIDGLENPPTKKQKVKAKAKSTVAKSKAKARKKSKAKKTAADVDAEIATEIAEEVNAAPLSDDIDWNEDPMADIDVNDLEMVDA